MSIDVEGLKARVRIEDVVGSYVALKKRGAEYLGLCPFHADKNPSFWVTPAKQFCHCFSCDANHDVISFVQEIEGLDFKAACEKLGATDSWAQKAPIKHEKAPKREERVTSKPPPDAQAPDFKIRGFGEPELTFPIRDISGEILGYECRYKGDGKKEIRVWTWGARGDEPAKWQPGHFNVPRPLYGLQRLKDIRQDTGELKPVSVFEGPKKAEAGKRLLPPYACLSWTGGANAWHKHDWTPLAGRKVLLWPDADEPGHTACQKLAALLSDPNGLACSVRIVDTGGQPEGWDVADAEADGWDTLKLVEWAKPRAYDYQPNPPPQVETAQAVVEEPPVEQAPPPPAPPPEEEYADGDDDDSAPASMSEDMLAQRFADEHGRHWRYVKPWSSWFEWRKDGWYRDETAKIDRLAVQLTRKALYWREAADLTPEGKRRVNSKRTAGAVRDLAMSDRRIAATTDQWDTDPWMLGVPGGVVDLRTGQFKDARPEDYMTKRTACHPEAGKPELWLQFLERITEGNHDLIAYLQRFAGYSLTGETGEHALAFLYGTGANGKSTFLQTLSSVFGDYAVSAGFEVFAESRNERHPTEIARLRGARLVITEETDAGGRWNEGRIKRLTGGGKISAHFMRQDDFEFEPHFKLLIAGNHKPMIKAVDEAIKRRIHLIPFTVTIPAEERDKRLLEKLEPEWPRILQWCIDGCMAWQADSLSPPDVILAATEKYVESEDTLGAWIDECCDRDPKYKCDGRTLFENYRKWCEAQGENAWSRKSWSSAMMDRGFDQKRTNSSRLFIGLTTKAAEPPSGGYEVD